MKVASFDRRRLVVGLWHRLTLMNCAFHSLFILSGQTYDHMFVSVIQRNNCDLWNFIINYLGFNGPCSSSLGENFRFIHPVTCFLREFIYWRIMNICFIMIFSLNIMIMFFKTMSSTYLENRLQMSKISSLDEVKLRNVYLSTS